MGEDLDARLPYESPVLAGAALASLVAVPLTMLARAAWRDDPSTDGLALRSGALLVGLDRRPDARPADIQLVPAHVRHDRARPRARRPARPVSNRRRPRTGDPVIAWDLGLYPTTPLTSDPVHVEEDDMDAIRLHGLEPLDWEECIALLSLGRVGRVGFVGAGWPRVLPVNYLMDGGVIVFRTAPGSLLSLVQGQPLTFEIDGFDEATKRGWSVCVEGYAQVDGDERDEARPELISWAPGPRPLRFAVVPDAITGRRIPMTATVADFGWIAGVVS